MSEEKPYKSVWGWDSVWEHLSWLDTRKYQFEYFYQFLFWFSYGKTLGH